MIITDLQHVDQQVPMTPALKKAIDFLRLRGVNDLPDGTVEIDGTNVFAIVQRYDTVKTDVPKFEYHQQYIDVQFIASGEEVIGWAPRERMLLTEAYNAGKDIAFGTVGKGNGLPRIFRQGSWPCFFPRMATPQKMRPALNRPS